MLAAALLLSTPAAALYEAGSAVLQGIDDSNYASKLKGLSVVELFAVRSG